MSCNKCNVEFGNDVDVAKCCECDQKYHLGCCRVRTTSAWKKLSGKKRNEWRCDECASDTGSVHSQPDSEESTSVFEMLKQIQQTLSADKKRTRQSFENLESNFKAVNDKLDDVASKLDRLEKENKELREECDRLKKHNEDLGTKVNSLQMEVWDLNQYSRINNLELQGIPFTPNEDVYNILETMANTLEVPYSRQDVSVAHRLSPPRRPGQHSSIVIQFVSRTTKSAWIAAGRRRKPQTTDLSTALLPGPVYVNEHLTAHNKMLLGRSRRLLREKKLAGAWCKDGKIFVKETATSPPKRVWTIEDIEAVVST